MTVKTGDDKFTHAQYFLPLTFNSENVEFITSTKNFQQCYN